MDQPLAATTATASAPLIVTAELPVMLQTWANGLRKEHYPPERNQLSAHVTLFHALPPFAEAEARDLLRALAGATAPPMARLSAIMDLGGGTALRIDCPDLLALRARVADHFHGMLTAQDGHSPRLHVTIQNKVVRAQARALQDILAIDFVPRDFRFAGLALHRYCGGPWEPAGRWAFRGKSR